MNINKLKHQRFSSENETYSLGNLAAKKQSFFFSKLGLVSQKLKNKLRKISIFLT